VLTLIVFYPVRVRAHVFLRLWFVYQLVEANFGFFSAEAHGGGGVAFFAHVGGFLFGAILTYALTRAGRIDAQDYDTVLGSPY
jgi:membrane associated rhomboid family serine protease